MHSDWTPDEVIEHFTLSSAEFEFLGSNAPHNHLGKALLLKFFQHEYRFPEGISETPPTIIEYVAQQLDIPAAAIEQYNWAVCSLKQHRKEICEQMGFRPATLDDQKDLCLWLISDVLAIHSYFAEAEREFISMRVKQGVAAVKTKGVKLGGQKAAAIKSAYWMHIGMRF